MVFSWIYDPLGRICSFLHGSDRSLRRPYSSVLPYKVCFWLHFARSDSNRQDLDWSGWHLDSSIDTHVLAASESCSVHKSAKQIRLDHTRPFLHGTQQSQRIPSVHMSANIMSSGHGQFRTETIPSSVTINGVLCRNIWSRTRPRVRTGCGVQHGADREREPVVRYKGETGGRRRGL